MSDNLGDARRALRSGETGEALVHLWNALEQARGEGDTRVFGRIADLAARAAAQGDEGDRAEAERLLAELRGELEEAVGTEDDDWTPPHGEPAAPPGAGPPPEITVPGGEPPGDAEEIEAEIEEEEQPQSRRRAALGWLIPIAIFLFFTFRDALS